MCLCISFHTKKTRINIEDLVITIVLLVIVTQQRGILSPPQILLEPALALGINVTSSAEQAEKDG